MSVLWDKNNLMLLNNSVLKIAIENAREIWNLYAQHEVYVLIAVRHRVKYKRRDNK